jgi:hypothetical protein
MWNSVHIEPPITSKGTTDMLASRFTLDARQAELLRSEDRYTVRELADNSRPSSGVRAAVASRLGWTPAVRPARLATR